MFNVNTVTLLVSVLALCVAWRSRELAQQAFSLSLFNNRYKFYHEFRNLIDELSSLPGFPTKKHLSRLNFLFLESKYIFGREIEALLESLFRNTEVVHKKQNPVGNKTDYEIVEPMREMTRLINELSGKEPGSAIDSYFQEYLYSEAFRLKV